MAAASGPQATVSGAPQCIPPKTKPQIILQDLATDAFLTHADRRDDGSHVIHEKGIRGFLGEPDSKGREGVRLTQALCGNAALPQDKRVSLEPDARRYIGRTYPDVAKALGIEVPPPACAGPLTGGDLEKFKALTTLPGAVPGRPLTTPEVVRARLQGLLTPTVKAAAEACGLLRPSAPQPPAPVPVAIPPGAPKSSEAVGPAFTRGPQSPLPPAPPSPKPSAPGAVAVVTPGSGAREAERGGRPDARRQALEKRVAGQGLLGQDLSGVVGDTFSAPEVAGAFEGAQGSPTPTGASEVSPRKGGGDTGSATIEPLGTSGGGEVPALEAPQEAEIKLPAGMEAPVVEGGTLDPERITQVVKSNFGGIKMVYDQELKRYPGLRAKLKFKITVTSGGRVEKVEVLERSVRPENDNLVPNIIQRIKTWRLPPSAGETTFELPLVFQPGL